MEWFLVTIVLALLGAVGVVLGKCWEWLTASVPDDVLSAADRERERLNGHWLAPLTLAEGGPAGAGAPTVKLFFVGRHFTLKWADGSFDQGTCKVDPNRKPPTIDFVVTEGAHVEKTLPGIYRRSRDGFQLCHAGAGQERPTQFVEDPARGWCLYVFVRE